MSELQWFLMGGMVGTFVMTIVFMLVVMREERKRDKESPWEPGRWWRVIDEDGDLWSETSNEQEAREDVRSPTDRLERLYERTEQQWRTEK